MTLTTTVTSIALILLAVCVVAWPTQWIPDRQYRWLRIAAVAAVVLQMIVDQPRLQLVPAYGVAMLFLLLLIAGPGTDGQPSSLRESQEGKRKKLVRWSLVMGSAAALVLAAFLTFTPA